jgi:deoxycytidine triphosphate deaminase
MTASVLSNVDILRAIESGKIAFDPSLRPDRICLAGVELGLGRIAWKSRPDDYDVTLTEDSPKLKIAPAELVKFTIHERLKLSNEFAAHVTGLPYFNQLGLFVFSGTQVEPGFNGKLTIVAFNFSGKTILVKHKTPICSLEIVRLETPADLSKRKTPFYFDIEAAMDTLEKTPQTKANRPPKDIEAAKEILRRIDAEQVIDTEGWEEYRDIDKRIYGYE